MAPSSENQTEVTVLVVGEWEWGEPGMWGQLPDALPAWPGSLLPLSAGSVALQDSATLDAGSWLCRQLVPLRVWGLEPDPIVQLKEEVCVSYLTLIPPPKSYTPQGAQWQNMDH